MFGYLEETLSHQVRRELANFGTDATWSCPCPITSPSNSEERSKSER